MGSNTNRAKENRKMIQGIKDYGLYLSVCMSRYLRDPRGVAAMEYAIITGVVVVAVGAAMATFSGDVKSVLGTIAQNLKASQGGIGSS